MSPHGTWPESAPWPEADAGAVMLSVEDLDGLELTLEILGDAEGVARIAESLSTLRHGEPGVDLATARADLARRRATSRADLGA